MFGRDEFFDKFNSISKNYSQNISIYYAINSNNSLGISYFNLNRLTNELSAFFSRIFKNSQYIGVRLTEYFYLPCIILGIWKSNCSFAGLADQYKKEDTLHYLNFLHIKYIITDQCDNGKLISRFVIDQNEFFIFSREVSDVDLGVNNICYGIMTSGSTGVPKIIQVPWLCILANAVELGEEFCISHNDCVFLASPCTFDPFFIELFLTLLNGSSLLTVPNSTKLCSSYLLQVLFVDSNQNDNDLMKVETDCENYFYTNVQKVKHKKVTFLQMTPSVFKRWRDEEIQNVILAPHSPLRVLVLGGEKFPNEILKLKNSNNTTKIYNIYGITEISCWAFLKEVTQPGTEISIGKPLSNILYKISENEFQIGSDTKICLVNNETISPDKQTIFRSTGDIVKVYNNELYFVSRNNQIVKKYGIKINLDEIEKLFLVYNPQIKECYCIYDEEKYTLGLFYVPVMASTNSNYELINNFNENYVIPLEKLKPVAKPDCFVEIKQPPLNCHGKCDKQKLLSYLKNIVMSHATDLRQIFKNILMDVLNVSCVNSSFINLGGNSVLALNLIRRLEDAGVKVSQEFITMLLSGKGFDDCLKCLSFEEKQISDKKLKIGFEIELSIKWRFDLGKCVDATPTVFVCNGLTQIVIGSHSSQLSCINAHTGSVIWTTHLGDRIESGFTVTADKTKGFIGCYDHHVYCISITDGSILWKFQTGDMVKSTPCLSSTEDILYVGSYDTQLYLLSSMNGEMKTSLKLSNNGIFCSGVVCPLNNFYIGTLDGTCVALNKENQLSWKLKLESPIFASPCLVPEKPEIIFSEVVGNIHLINTLNGTKMRTFKAGGNIYSTPIYNAEYNQILFGCHDAHLYCIQYGELNLKWKQPLQSAIFAKPTLIKSSLVCVSTTEGFICLLSSDGSVLGRVKLNGEIFSSVVGCDNQIIVGCRDNNVYCIETKNR